MRHAHKDSPLRRAHHAWCWSLLVLVIALGMFRPVDVVAEDGHKAKVVKKSSAHSAEKSGKTKAKRKRSSKGEVDDEPVVGGDGHNATKDFDADLAVGGTVDAVLVIDSSASMLRTDPQRLRDQGAKLLLRFLGDGDRVAVVQFDRSSKVISPFVTVTSGELERLDKEISAIVANGGFTDIASGLEEALRLFKEGGRSDTIKAVILLSDGKMDPHPSRGAPAELTEKVRAEQLPGFREANISLYTLSLSGEADKELLGSFAKEAGGQHWFAPDANTIHRKFSELFLSIKKPQVLPLEGAGFEIDSGIQEATFYVNKQDGQQVIVVDPRGTELDSTHIPPNVKWFSGALFDVVTVRQPLPGRWAVKGIENPEGFASLLSDLKLQVRWPNPTLKIGDTVAVYARLTNAGEPVSTPGFDEILFFTYKIVSSEKGQVLASGSLSDDGEHGDEKAKDGIYSTKIKLDHEGEFQGLFAATSPTFTRQQRVPFSVSASLISMRVAKGDEFTGAKTRFEVVLSEGAKLLKKPKLQLVATRTGEEKKIGITIAKDKLSEDVYEVPLEKLKAGEYQLYARITGFDPKSKKDVSAASETLPFTVSGGGTGEGEEVADEEVAAEGEEEAVEEDSSSLIFGLVSVVLSLVWIGGLWWWGMKKIAATETHVEERVEWEPDEELVQRIELIRGRSSATKRPVGAQDREIFAAVPDALGASGEQS